MSTSFRTSLKVYNALGAKFRGRVGFEHQLRFFLPWAKSLEPGRSPIGDQNIWVVFAARTFLDRILKPGMNVFEYGAGGSTLYFLKKGCQVVSVEHHPEWFQTVADEVSKRQYSAWRGFLRQADANRPTRGEPDLLRNCRSEFGEYAGRTFFDYVEVVDQFPDASLDLVLVDGRARPSCFAHAHKKVKQGGALVLDNSERPRYEIIHKTLQTMPWQKREFFGPGPYVNHEFWGTTIWTRQG